MLKKLLRVVTGNGDKCCTDGIVCCCNVKTCKCVSEKGCKGCWRN